MKPYSSDIEGAMRIHYKSLNEKDRRHYAAVETKKLGHGGQTYLAGVLGCSDATIRRGLRELDHALEELDHGAEDDQPARIRQKGGGRKPYDQTHPNIDEQFLKVLEEHTAGDPTGKQLKWTNLSQPEIAGHLKQESDIEVSIFVVRKLLRKHGFGRRKAQKRVPIKQVAGRNEQFENIARLKEQYRKAGEPIISIDTKKKEQIGNFYRPGSLYTRQTVGVFDHDFNRFADGVLIPHGIYDLAHNSGFINIGTSHDTSEFACDCLRTWWRQRGRKDWPQASSLLILCDCGGSNSSRYYIFKKDLQQVADELGLSIRVAHYPPYCSKYNPIEHRLFPHVTRACQGVIFKSVQLAAELIAKTKTAVGLYVKVNLIDKAYETGRKVSAQFKKNMRILKDNYLPQWNYVAVPAKIQNA